MALRRRLLRCLPEAQWLDACYEQIIQRCKDTVDAKHLIFRAVMRASSWSYREAVESYLATVSMLTLTIVSSTTLDLNARILTNDALTGVSHFNDALTNVHSSDGQNTVSIPTVLHPLSEACNFSMYEFYEVQQLKITCDRLLPDCSNGDVSRQMVATAPDLWRNHAPLGVIRTQRERFLEEF